MSSDLDKVKGGLHERSPRAGKILLEPISLDKSILSPEDQFLILEYGGYKIFRYSDWMLHSRGDIKTWQMYYKQISENDEGFIVLYRDGNYKYKGLTKIEELFSILVQRNISFTVAHINAKSLNDYHWLIKIEGRHEIICKHLYKGLLEEIFKMAKLWKREISNNK